MKKTSIKAESSDSVAENRNGVLTLTLFHNIPPMKFAGKTASPTTALYAPIAEPLFASGARLETYAFAEVLVSAMNMP